MLTTAIKQRVIDKLTAGIALANRRYGVTIPFPTVIYKKRGTTAGTANYRTWTIDLNPVLLTENVDQFIERTVPHELAHLITYKVYPQAYETEVVRTRTGFRRTKRDVHGSYWQEVMRTLGVADIKRCHSYDVTNAKQRKNTTTYKYKCEGCGHEFNLSPQRHAKLVADPRAYRHTSCNSARRYLVPAGTATVAATPARPASPAPGARPAAKPAGTGSSKIDRCYGWYKHYKDQGTANLRQMCIAVFIQEVGMTPAGAATYFSNCQKMDR
jgi:SprT protein